MLVVWSPFPASWWATRLTVVHVGTYLIALPPCIALMGFTLAKLFGYKAGSSTVVSMVIALVVALVYVPIDPHHPLAAVKTTRMLALPFLVGTPLIAYFFERHFIDNGTFKRQYHSTDPWLRKAGYFWRSWNMRSNNRWRGRKS